MLRLIGSSVFLAVVCVIVSHAGTEFGLRSDDFPLRQSEKSEIRNRSLTPQYGPRLSEHGNHRLTMAWYGDGLLWPPVFEPGDVRTVLADTTKTEKKKRQKKRDATPPARRKDPDTQKTSDDDDDAFFGCLGGCVIFFIELLCGSLDDGDTGQVTTTTTIEDGSQIGTGTDSEPVAPAAAATLVALPYSGVLKPLNPYASEIDLWDVAGGAAAGGEKMAELTRNSRVSVVEREIYNNIEWVRVQCAEVPEPGGWIQEIEVSLSSASPVYHEPGEPDDATTAGQVTQSFPDIKDASWAILADLSYPMFGNRMLREEYKNSLRVGAESRFLFVHSIQVDLSFGFSHSNGEPQYDYVTSTTREVPIESDLDIWSIGARVGQLFAFPIGGDHFFFTYDLGPTVFNVRESATLEIYEGKEMTGTRKDKLSEWKIGGEAKIELGGIIKGRFPLGAHTRVSVIPWDTNEEKSLTLDFLNDNSIYVFNFGINIGYLFY